MSAGRPRERPPRWGEIIPVLLRHQGRGTYEETIEELEALGIDLTTLHPYGNGIPDSDRISKWRNKAKAEIAEQHPINSAWMHVIECRKAVQEAKKLLEEAEEHAEQAREAHTLAVQQLEEAQRIAAQELHKSP